ncbi:hypothetical protein [uncultured Friedmanniella sp.]|uniref:hypothetical protein n=1 Tax=uncultured Friedmanniella sp. TaxID=335381 RepID=UPI0035C96E4F
MPVPVQVFADVDDLGAAAADLVLGLLAQQPAGAPFLLGCPGGRSLQSTYAHLAERAAAARVDLRGLRVVMMDEYVERDPAGGWTPVDPALPHSCRRFGAREIVGRINTALIDGGIDPQRLVPPTSLWVPDPADPAAYDGLIEAAGGIDLFLLASGASDGHIAFNPPGTAPTARTRMVELPESTRRDNLATFPSFGGDLDAVPSHGVTVGVATIREQSKAVLMVVHGTDKQRAADRLTRASTYEPDWPATVLADCRSPQLFVAALR